MSTMTAVHFTQHGGPDVLRVGPVQRPAIEAGTVLVRVRAAGVNHIDLWMREGMPKLVIPLPHVPGGDVAGELAEIGPGVAGFSVGQRVVVNPGLSCGRCARCRDGQDNLCLDFGLIGEACWGGQAEFLRVPAENLVPLPDAIDDVTAAATPVTYLTAWHMLVDRARLAAGQWVLVWAAGSGVGSAGVQIAKLVGARVIATASSEDKRAQARALGADVVFDSAAPELLAEVKRLTGGAGVDVVFEHTGAATFATSVRAAARGGVVVTCGATSGARAELDLRHVFWRQLSILGATLAPRGRLFKLVSLIAQGKLRPNVDRVLPMADVAQAHAAIANRQVFGKIVLRV